MVDPHPTPDVEPVQRALAEVAERVPGLTFHPGASGHRPTPYVDGVLASTSEAPGTELWIERSDRWHERAVVVRLAAGPYGAWSKPPVPDPDHQEGGLTFLPEHEVPPVDGMLLEFPETQAALHRLWLEAKPTEPELRGLDGLAIMVRPDAVVAHLRTPAVTADRLEALIHHLPDVAVAARVHDPEWQETVLPERDRYLYPLAVVVAVLLLGAVIFWLRYATT